MDVFKHLYKPTDHYVLSILFIFEVAITGSKHLYCESVIEYFLSLGILILTQMNKLVTIQLLAFLSFS